jgi:hypothetical protein
LPDAHKNFAASLVATAPSPAFSGASLVVTAADGAKFPAVPFNATIWPASAQPTTANAEIVRVTNISTDTFTITRAQESSSARTVVIGDQIAATITAKTLTDVEVDVNPNIYLTVADETIPANTQVIYDDYLELAASFEYELASGAILVIGDFATPLAPPDQNRNIFVTVADELVPSNSEVVFSDFYEVSAPFASEIASGGEIQLGTDTYTSSVLLPGYEYNYTQITSFVTISSTTVSAPTLVFTTIPTIWFDGAPVMVEFYSPDVEPPNVSAGSISVYLYEGAALTALARLFYYQSDSSTQAVVTGNGWYRFTPTVGYHSYSVHAVVNNAGGSPFIDAGTGGSANPPPAFVRFTKV